MLLDLTGRMEGSNGFTCLPRDNPWLIDHLAPHRASMPAASDLNELADEHVSGGIHSTHCRVSAAAIQMFQEGHGIELDAGMHQQGNMATDG